MKQALLAKLLEQIDPLMSCDLCPSFKLIIHNGNIDVELFTEEGDMEWVLLDEDTRVRLRDVIDSLGVLEHTVRGLDKLKERVAHLLIREVHAGNLFKAPRFYEETGNEEIQ